MSEPPEVGSVIYEISDKNTSFKALLNTHSTETFFICNDLKNKKDYENQTINWNKAYNSVMLATIRSHNPKTNSWTIYGAIAIDSKNSNDYPLFNGPECRNILGFAADYIATFMLSMEELKNVKGNSARRQSPRN